MKYKWEFIIMKNKFVTTLPPWVRPKAGRYIMRCMIQSTQR